MHAECNFDSSDRHRCQHEPASWDRLMQQNRALNPYHPGISASARTMHDAAHVLPMLTVSLRKTVQNEINFNDNCRIYYTVHWLAGCGVSVKSYSVLQFDTYYLTGLNLSDLFASEENHDWCLFYVSKTTSWKPLINSDFHNFPTPIHTHSPNERWT